MFLLSSSRWNKQQWDWVAGTELCLNQKVMADVVTGGAGLVS